MLLKKGSLVSFSPRESGEQIIILTLEDQQLNIDKIYCCNLVIANKLGKESCFRKVGQSWTLSFISSNYRILVEAK